MQIRRRNNKLRVPWILNWLLLLCFSVVKAQDYRPANPTMDFVPQNMGIQDTGYPSSLHHTNELAQTGQCDACHEHVVEAFTVQPPTYPPSSSTPTPASCENCHFWDHPTNPSIHAPGHINTWGPSMYGMHPDKLALGFDPDHLPSGGTHMDTYGLVQCQFCHPDVSFNPYGSGAIRFCENCHTIQLLHGNSEHMETNNIYTVNGIPNQQVTANEKCAACHHHTDHTIAFSVGQIIAYTGHLDKTPSGVLADTLITVTHGRKSDIKAKIAVYDRSGNKVAESSFLDGGEKLANSFIPQEGLGWIALGMIVNQATLNPTGSPGMEIFSFKILVGKSGAILRPVVVGVKEIVYHSRQENTGKAIWNTTQIASWSNTVLGGGQHGTAIVKHDE